LPIRAGNGGQPDEQESEAAFELGGTLGSNIVAIFG